MEEYEAVDQLIEYVTRQHEHNTLKSDTLNKFLESLEDRQ